MKKILLFAMIFVCVLLQSCRVLFFRKVTCRAYKINSEKFWFQGKLNSNYTLVNNKTKEEKEFKLADKWISTRDEYYSDTGCDCHNLSSQLLITNKDSIWTKSDSRYWEGNKAKVYDSYTFRFENSNWLFNDETSIVTNDVKIINGKRVNTRTYTEEYENVSYVLVLGEGIGVISVKLGKNEEWIRKSLVVENIDEMNGYRTMKSVCN